jgi:hypothetical protein
VIAAATKIDRRGRRVKQTSGKLRANQQVRAAQLFAIAGKLDSRAREAPVLR